MIKFEHNISHSKISFLDTWIYKDKNNTLHKTLYQKPTDQQSYLHAHSDHSKSLKGMKNEIDKVDNFYRKDMLSKKEKNI